MVRTGLTYTDLFRYSDGNLYWLKSGKLAGWLKNYRYVCVNNVHTQVHRVIWEMHNGPIPEGYFIDHINKDKLDNRLINLRLATKSQNEANTTKRKNNTSGFKGVYKWKTKFRAKLQHNGEEHHLGYFNTPEEAAIAYNKKAIEVYGEYADIN